MASHVTMGIKGLAGMAAALGMLLPLPAAAKCKLSSLDLPVTMAGGRPITKVSINGTEVKLLVDSGAFFSFLTDAAATQLQLPLSHIPFGMRVTGLTGEVEARVTRVKRLQLPQGEVPDVDFVVGGNEPGGGAMGLLGRNFLSFADAEYDLAHGMVRLMFPEDCAKTMLAYWAGSTPVSELTLQRDYGEKQPAIKATAKLNGKSIHVLFDTGAQSVISLAAAKRAGISSDDMKPAAEVRGAGRGAVKAWTAPVETFELGGERIQNSRLTVADFDMDGIDMLIGVDFFLSHRLYVANAQRKIYFTYHGGPVFALSNATNPDSPDVGDPLADAAAYARRGAASAARRDFSRALVDLDRACELEPTVAAHFTQRGTLQALLEHPEKALRDFDVALRLDPGEADARLYRARIRQLADDRDGAVDDLRTLDKFLAAQAHMRMEMAKTYERMGLYDEALPQWNRWIPAHPNDAELPVALNNRCWALALLDKELDQALDDCNAAIRQEPDNASFLDSRGWVRLRQGKLREAVADYDRALKARPQAAWSLYGRGIARIRQGERERGLADIEAARQQQPSIDHETGRFGITVP